VTAKPTRMSPQESAANILQCRMSWPLAERCTAALAGRLVDDLHGFEAITQTQAVEILLPLMEGRPEWARKRAEGAVGDLVMAGLIRSKKTKGDPR
jgi:hypothetical protein